MIFNDIGTYHPIYQVSLSKEKYRKHASSKKQNSENSKHFIVLKNPKDNLKENKGVLLITQMSLKFYC